MFLFDYNELCLMWKKKLSRLVNAATGTGKTVAYLAPIINHLQSYSPRIDRSSGTFGKDEL